MEGLKALFYGRKFWLAILAVVQSVLFAFTTVPKELWLSVDALLVAVIVTIAWEDSALKAAGKLPLSSDSLERALHKTFGMLARSRKVWLAGAGVLQTFLFYFIPNFPQEVWLSINGVLIVVIGTIAAEDAAAKRFVG